MYGDYNKLMANASTGAGVGANGAAASFLVLIVGVGMILSHHLAAGLIVCAVAGLGIPGSLVVGLLIDDHLDRPRSPATDQAAEEELAQANEAREQEAGDAPQADTFIQAPRAVDVDSLHQLLQRMEQRAARAERRAAWLTWLTCALGIAISVICTVYAEQLSHLSR
jgi:hypothetical protein